ncbi:MULTISPECIES: response regulator transcription factor [unclassified Clostridium]|uniref:response regulator transcription factor n=1 Tax=unclassified Clostridium TaxID=2614128 RepID=UPI0015F6BC8A|nr:response regulator transcription factor [Clostridium sp. cel8]MBA5851560.1 response regulator transcription factor [Clostridium sp. cel8]
MAKILVIDDEKDILTLIKNVLSKDNHFVVTVDNAINLSSGDFIGYDLILLDVMMPDIDGFTLCKKIRDIVDCPIIFLTAKTMESDIMFGLGIGADDYITKPFSVGELKARVNAHIRREQRERHNFLVVSDIKFNLLSKEVFVDNKKIPFTKSEYAICEYLARNHGQVFSKENIYEGVFGYDGESNSSVIAEHIKNIRAKLAVFDVNPIETVWGIGYKWR